MPSVTANIGPLQRRKRLTFGVVLLGASLVAAAMLIHADVARGWRILLVLPLGAAALGIFQARERTWVKLAARGQRDMDKGAEDISDPVELSTIRRQARSIYLKAWVAASFLTILLTLLWTWSIARRAAPGPPRPRLRRP
jgi:hypothetical protein